jgi:hypothetical protein
MVEAHWESLRDRELRYVGHTWRLTGDVDVRESGELLAAEAVQADDVRHEPAILHFGLRDPPGSLNPGDLDGHFESLERDGRAQYLVVEADGRTYRYRLGRLERV